MDTEKNNTARRYWLWQVTALALFLGLLLGTVLRAQQNFTAQNIYASRYGVPPSVYRDQGKRIEELTQENQQLQQDKTKLATALSESGAEKLQTLNRELQAANTFAGFTPLQGSGVIVTLNDSPLKPNPAWPYVQEDYIIHDMHIFAVVNELRVAGAEAIAINDQRLSARSAIRCEGPTVRVNYTQVGVPLEIRAIGDPQALASGLEMLGGLLDPKSSLVFLKMAKVTRSDQVVVPAYSGGSDFKYATPVP